MMVEPIFFIPIVVIGLVLAYSYWARKRAVAVVASGQGGQLFHDSQSGYFPELTDRERILAVWQGRADSTPRGVTGTVANAVSANVIGVSTYVPNVLVALTTDGRLMVSEEYSSLGQRGNYRSAVVLPSGARAEVGNSLGFAHQDKAPKNPFNPVEHLVPAAIHSADGALAYRAWLSPVALAGEQLARSIGDVLPFEPANGAAIWARVNPAAPQL
jgi:hypothetical protein